MKLTDVFKAATQTVNVPSIVLVIIFMLIQIFQTSGIYGVAQNTATAREPTPEEIQMKAEERKAIKDLTKAMIELTTSVQSLKDITGEKFNSLNSKVDNIDRRVERLEDKKN